MTAKGFWKIQPHRIMDGMAQAAARTEIKPQVTQGAQSEMSIVRANNKKKQKCGEPEDQL